MCETTQSINYANLRYFNPAGAHESGLIGEQIDNNSKNLFPVISNLANYKHKRLNIYGNDYDTSDGTPIRDYIHIMDLVDGHIKALEYLDQKKSNLTVNLGTGSGQSV